MDNLNQLWTLLAAPQNLIIAFCIAVGYIVKGLPFVPNRYVELIVTIASVSACLTVPFDHPLIPAERIIYGFIYAVISFKVYDWLISKVESFLPPRPLTGPLPLILTGALALGLVGCVSLTPTYSALPPSATPAQKTAALAADAKAKLSDPNVQTGARNALAFAGKLALQKAVDPADRTEIQNQLYSWATAFETLATGKVVTAAEVDDAAHSFNTGFSASKYGDFLSAANGVWQLFYPQLKLAGDAELTRQWLLVLSGAARDAAGGS